MPLIGPYIHRGRYTPPRWPFALDRAHPLARDMVACVMVGPGVPFELVRRRPLTSFGGATTRAFETGVIASDTAAGTDEYWGLDTESIVLPTNSVGASVAACGFLDSDTGINTYFSLGDSGNNTPYFHASQATTTRFYCYGRTDASESKNEFTTISAGVPVRGVGVYDPGTGNLHTYANGAADTPGAWTVTGDITCNVISVGAMKRVSAANELDGAVAWGAAWARALDVDTERVPLSQRDIIYDAIEEFGRTTWFLPAAGGGGPVALAGDLDALSSVSSAQLEATREVAGNVDSLSAVIAAQLEVQRPVTGNTASLSTLSSAELNITVDLQALAPALSIISPALLSTTRALAATGPASSIIGAAESLVTRALDGSLVSLSTCAADTEVHRPLQGACAALSVFTGDITLGGEVSLGGALDALSQLTTAQLETARPLQGSAVSLSAVAGATLQANRTLSSSVIAISDFPVALLRADRSLQATLASSSTASGTLTDQVTGPGATPEQIAEAVWTMSMDLKTWPSGSFGEQVKKKLLTVAKFLGLQ